MAKRNRRKKHRMLACVCRRKKVTQSLKPGLKYYEGTDCICTLVGAKGKPKDYDVVLMQSR